MRTNRMYWTDYLFILPGLLLSVFIILVPGVMTIFYGFTDWNGVSANYNWIGLQNFKEMVNDEIFWRALKNNVIWTVLFLTIPVGIGLLTSFFLLYARRTYKAYQAVFIMPYILAPVTNAMLWLNIIFNPVSGLIGYLNSHGFNFGAPLGNTKTALYAVAGVDIWHYWGFLMVVYFAALRQTPEDQIEASVLEGCSFWQQFKYIYYPNIKTTMKLMFIMIIIFSFMTFDYVYLLTGGGPARATEMLSTYANSYFTTFQTGKAAAVAFIMSMFGLLAASIYVRLSRGEELE
ncbi:sugar ABC transporter permease [uncultured Sphaerochaeta sp.]|uniref:carbohydrate ABC transporter permease n=1 Tax=uncultured Sphaerochaeta sp. TaxID=886478 RepID=UPI0029C86632|nr:sugar ABC transporter permease [uncultured Sphaerochaeta sp.]